MQQSRYRLFKAELSLLKKAGTWQVFVFVLEKEEKVVKFLKLTFAPRSTHYFILCRLPTNISAPAYLTLLITLLWTTTSRLLTLVHPTLTRYLELG